MKTHLRVRQQYRGVILDGTLVLRHAVPPLWSGVVLDAGKGVGRILLDGIPTDKRR